jgi:hypothetical protein
VKRENLPTEKHSSRTTFKCNDIGFTVTLGQMAVRSLGLKTRFFSKENRSSGVKMLSKAPYHRKRKI